MYLYIVGPVKNYIIMRRTSEASLFFLGFPRKKRSLHNGSYENSFAKAIWWWMLYRILRKKTCTNMRRNMYVVTPRCAAAAAVVAAVWLRRPTKEYTHPYSHDASQIAYCRYWGRASLPPIISTGIGTHDNEQVLGPNWNFLPAGRYYVGWDWRPFLAENVADLFG